MIQTSLRYSQILFYILKNKHMRPIKFQAFNKQSKEITEINFLIHWFMFDNPIYEIMQFTWLLDKNWKEIYEGYIVREAWYDLILVEWLNDSCWFEPFSDSKGSCWCCGYWKNPAIHEIIWNIYQNPELLKDE